MSWRCLVACGFLLLAFSARSLAEQKDEASLLRELDSVQDSSAAYELGRLWSVKGLEKLIGRRSEVVIRGFEHGMSLGEPARHRGNPELSPGIEALIVQYFDAPEVGVPLQKLLVGRRYQGKELFERLYTRIKLPDLKAEDYQSLAHRLINTDLPIEAQVFDLLGYYPRGLTTEQGWRALLFYLAEKRYAAVVPLLKETLAIADPAEAYLILESLVRFGTIDSLEAISAYAEQVGIGPDKEQAHKLLKDLLKMLVGLPATAPFDLSALRRLLPKPTPREIGESYIRFVERRLDVAGVPDLIGFLSEKDLRESARAALLAFESPEVWKKAEAELARLRDGGHVAGPEYNRLVAAFLDRLRDPDVAVEKQRGIRRTKEADRLLQEGLTALAQDKHKLDELKASKSELWLSSELAYIQALERLRAAHNEAIGAAELSDKIAAGQMAVAHFLRFRQHQPAEAIAIYTATRDAATGRPWPKASTYELCIGDTYQFDLQDAPRAIEAYERALRFLETHEPAFDEVEMTAWQKAWLRSEIDYLKTGKRYSGTPGADEGIWAISALWVNGLDCGDILAKKWTWESIVADRDRLTRELPELSPSHLTSLCTLSPATLFSSEAEVRSYFTRNDPAGYWTACVSRLALQLADRDWSATPEEPQPMVLAFFPGLKGEHGGRQSAFAKAAAAFVRTEDAEPQPIDSRWADYYPAEIGHEWVWELSTPAQGGAPAEIGTITLRVRRKELDERSGIVTYFDEDDRRLFQLTPAGLVSPDGTLFLTPSLKAWSSWITEAGSNAPQRRYRVLEAGVPVTIRNNTWSDCLVLEVDMRPAAFIDESRKGVEYLRFGETGTLCRGVGLVRESAYEITDEGRRILGTRELVSFKTGRAVSAIAASPSSPLIEREKAFRYVDTLSGAK